MIILFPNPAPPLLQKILNIVKNDVAISLWRMNKRSSDQGRGMHAASPPKKIISDIITPEPAPKDVISPQNYTTKNKGICISLVSERTVSGIVSSLQPKYTNRIPIFLIRSIQYTVYTPTEHQKHPSQKMPHLSFVTKGSALPRTLVVLLSRSEYK